MRARLGGVDTHDSKTCEGQPRPAIRAYPARYVTPWTMKNGAPVVLRPIRPQDEPAMARFHETLSDRSVFLRFFNMQKLSSRVAHERLLHRCLVDYDQEMALVADYADPQSGEQEIIAVGRITREPGTQTAEVAVLVSDRFQRCGLGSKLLGRLIQVARDEKLESVNAIILLENTGMLAIVKRYGFQVFRDSDDGSLIRAVLML